MVILRGKPPPRDIVTFFERIIPGFWQRWITAAESALREIDADAGGQTIITSWHRSPLENRQAKGEPDSQHLLGLALDVVPAKGNRTLAINEAAQRFQQAGFVTVIFDAGDGTGHLHVQTFPAHLLRAAGIFDALGL